MKIYIKYKEIIYNEKLSNNGKMIECRFIINISDDYICYLHFYYPMDNKIRIEFEYLPNKLYY
jgi:hypothetical protein